MNKFVILADSTCDLSKEFQLRYDIHIIQGHIILPDGREISSFQKWEEFDHDEFYNDLKKNPNSYSTSPPNTNEFFEAFEEYAENGTEILAITISSGISGAYGFACKAKDDIIAKYPNCKINVVDSMRFGPGFGLMTIWAAELRNKGLSLDEVYQLIEKHKNRFRQAGWLDDLSFVAKKGRITHPKAFFGTLAGIKPLGETDTNGLTTVIGKVKGTKKAYAVLMEYIEQTIENPSEQIIFIAHTNRYNQAVAYKEMIEKRFHPKAIYVSDVFPSCGINIGLGLMAAYYYGKPISEGLVEEKRIIKNSIGVSDT